MNDICVIGGGVAGMTAALYAQRSGLSCTVFEKNIFGGQIASSDRVENYPGIKLTGGAELALAVYEQAAAQGAQFRFEEVSALKPAGSHFEITASGGVCTARAVIFAGGAARRKLGCDGEQRLSGRGVSYCATCDGAFFRSKTVAVVGGGNTALEDALFLSDLCEKVYLIHRRDSFRGDAVLAKSALSRSNIQPVLRAQVTSVDGGERVEGVTVSQEGGDTLSIKLDGVFIAVGMIPDTSLIGGLAELDGSGYAVAGEDGVTGTPGLFVAGDCRTKQLRQLVTAASDGACAAFSAASYIHSLA